ncbi:MAG: beta-lactamase family protein [Clostridiales bacterium]|nr:beta-lactamase family protein [Clostridiales bacterium]
MKDFRKVSALLICSSIAFGVIGCSGSAPAGTGPATSSATAGTTMTATEEATETTAAETAGEAEEGPYDIADIEVEGGRVWTNDDPAYEALVDSYKYGYDRYGVYLVATDDDIVVMYCEDALQTDGVTPVCQYTTYDIASCSKLFTATAIFQLMEQGLISLDDTIDQYFPEYEAGSQITISDLLHMRSGIPDYLNEFDLFWRDYDEENMEEFYRIVASDGFSDQDLLDNMYDADLLFEPGTQMSYSNTNYTLLAMIVEELSGMAFCDYMQEYIFDVCGMEHTSMAAGDETSVILNWEEPYELGLVDTNGHSMMPNTDRGDGGIHTCLADLLAFDRALFGGQLVSEGSLAEMTNWIDNYGCALMRNTGSSGAYHMGGAFTYISSNTILDSQNFGHVYIIMFIHQ